MKYFSIALMCEAKYFIEKLALKKIDAPFPLYKNDTYILSINGIGKQNAALAAGYTYGRFPFQSALNVGIAAGSDACAIGACYSVNKILDFDTKREYYPEMLFRTPFLEASLCSYSLPATDDNGYMLGDMEGSAFFASVTKFCYLQNIALFKVVSDHFDPAIPNPKSCAELIEKNAQAIIDYAAMLDTESKGDFISQDVEALVALALASFALTHSQIQILKGLLQYRFVAQNFDREEFIATLRSTNKREIFLERYKELCV